jgi:beta-lactamase class A
MPNMQRAARLLRDYTLPPKEHWTATLAEEVNAAVAAVRPGTPAWDYAMKVLADDPRDQGSPDGFVALLQALHERRTVSPDSTAVALDIMRRCRGDALRALLPPDVVVAHKPGGGPGSNNDVGLIEVPGGPVLAIAVLMRNSTSSGGANERAIAMASRVAFDTLTRATRG